jgi:hypothetical protein
MDGDVWVFLGRACAGRLVKLSCAREAPTAHAAPAIHTILGRGAGVLHTWDPGARLRGADRTKLERIGLGGLPGPALQAHA